jgi:hypothetical protein
MVYGPWSTVLPFHLPGQVDRQERHGPTVVVLLAQRPLNSQVIEQLEPKPRQRKQEEQVLKPEN